MARRPNGDQSIRDQGCAPILINLLSRERQNLIEIFDCIYFISATSRKLNQMMIFGEIGARIMFKDLKIKMFISNLIAVL